MKTLEGAVGLSSGLKYVPGAYAKTEEVIELGPFEILSAIGRGTAGRRRHRVYRSAQHPSHLELRVIER